MAAIFATSAGTQNSTTTNNNANQNNVCEVRRNRRHFSILSLTFRIQNCFLRPRWFDPTSGVLHNFCSRTCAKANGAVANCEVLFSTRLITGQSTVWLMVPFPLVPVVLQSSTEVQRRTVHSPVLFSDLRQRCKVQRHSER